MADLMDISSAKASVTLTPSATAFEPCRAIFVEVAGSATFQFVDGGTDSFTTLPVGERPFCIKKMTAGTATVHALY